MKMFDQSIALALEFDSVENASLYYLSLGSFLYFQDRNIVYIGYSGSYLLKDGNYQTIDNFGFAENTNKLICDLLHETRTEVIFPQNTVEINAYAFGEANISTIKCNNGLKKIGIGSFSGCKKLNNVSLNSDLLYIDYSAFYGCCNLKNIVLPKSLKYIAQFAFYDAALEYVVIPKEVFDIRSMAFNNTTIYCEVERDYWDWNSDFAVNCDVYYKGEWEYINDIPQPII